MPLDFTASGLTHSKPAGTLDFTVPEHLLFQFDIDAGTLTHISSGHISGQFLESQWNGVPSYHAPGNVVVTSWASTPIYIGVGHSENGDEFGSLTLVQDQIIAPEGFGGHTLGVVQTSPNSVYIHSTGTLIAKWGDVVYSPSRSNQGGSWSDVVIITPVSIEPTVVFGSSSIVQELFIGTEGFTSGVFGSNYVLRWFEYAPPVFDADVSWLGENEYTAPVFSVNVNWLPSTGAQTIGPVSFDHSRVPSPRFVRVITVVGEDSLAFGAHTVDLPGCSNYVFTGPGNQVPISFYNAKTTYEGNQVPITFACDTPTGNYTYFTDFIQVYDGPTFDFDISPTFRLEFLSGESVVLEGMEVSTSEIRLDFSSGDTFDFASLETEILIPVEFFSGEQLPSNDFLTVPPAPQLSNLRFYGDAEVSAYLATDATFGFDYYSDASASLTLNTYPPALLSLDVRDGASVANVGLWTQSALEPNAYDGGTFAADITINPSADLLFEIGEGGAGSIVLSTAIQLGNILGYDGSRLDASLDTLENWHLYDGTSVTITIATDVSLSAAGYAGESASATLSTFPSEGLGVFYAYDGAQALASFTTLPQVLLYPNEIKVPDAFHYDILGHMGIDLNNGTCCPVVDNHARIELSDGPAPDERYDGDKVVVQVDLSTLPRFSMGFAEGAHFEGVDPEYLTFNFFDGQAGITSDLQFDEYNFNLCKGNFIPDGDHINVELISNVLNNCEAIVMFDGAESSLDLSAKPQFAVPLPTGERFDFDFVIIPALVFRFYTGEFVRISNPEFSPHFAEDAYTNFAFEEKDIVGYSGAEMTLLSLTTDYDVEFLERGCLDNEFVPANENGDPDMERFNPVPVELDFFTHSIRARCY